MKPFLIISLLILCYACNSTEQQKQINLLTTMIEKTDSLKQAAEQNKIDSVVEYQLAANSLMLRLKNNYKPTKVDMIFGHEVDEFKELQMLFVKEKEENKRTLSDEYLVILSSLSEEKKTLITLKEDIENGSGDKEKYTEYIQFEQDKLTMIQDLLAHFIMRKKKYLMNLNGVGIATLN
jgi:hypothetical protein